MFFRAVIFLILIFLLYKVLKSFKVNRLAKNKEEGVSPRIVGEDLVEDPVCHKHIPVSQAYKKDIAGKTHYFCDKECLEKYTSANQR